MRLLLFYLSSERTQNLICTVTVIVELEKVRKRTRKVKVELYGEGKGRVGDKMGWDGIGMG